MSFIKNFLDGFKREEGGLGYEPDGPAVYAKNAQGVDSGKAGSDSEKAADLEGTTTPDYGDRNYTNHQSTHVTADGGAILVSDETALKRNLHGRHMQFIALGGSIGTGLFIGSGSALASGGPGWLLIDFMLIGIMVYTVVMALGELATIFPVSGSFASYSSRFIDPAWGFAMGWNYWMQWFIVLPLELTAATIVIQYWDPDFSSCPKGVYVFVFLLAITIINLFGVRGYGEFEFGASLIKVIAVIAFIILGIIINAGGVDGRYRGAATWHIDGLPAFANGFKGFCSVFVTAAFAFAGTELIGLAAAETANPRKEVPKAAKQITFRIIIFYVVSLLLITLLVPYNDPRLNGATSYDARASPFVIAINDAGIKALPSIFNAVILISVLSVGNSAVYGASRTLCALAQSGQAPKVFTYIDREGRPLPAVALSLLMGFLAFLIYASEDANNTVFNWLLALSGLSSIFSWGSCNLAHLRFRQAWKRAGHTVEELPWAAPTGVAGSVFGLGFNILVLVLQFYKAAFPIGEAKLGPKDRVDNFFQSYLAVPVVMLFYFGYKLYRRTRILRIDEMDVTTGRRDPIPVEVLRRERAEEAAKPLYVRVWNFFF